MVVKLILLQKLLKCGLNGKNQMQYSHFEEESKTGNNVAFSSQYLPLAILVP